MNLSWYIMSNVQYYEFIMIIQKYTLIIKRTNVWLVKYKSVGRQIKFVYNNTINLQTFIYYCYKIHDHLSILHTCNECVMKSPWTIYCFKLLYKFTLCILPNHYCFESYKYSPTKLMIAKYIIIFNICLIMYQNKFVDKLNKIYHNAMQFYSKYILRLILTLVKLMQKKSVFNKISNGINRVL